MPLLDLSGDELRLLRDLADAGIVTWEAHRRRTADVYVEAAIGVHIQDAIALRQKIVDAGKPAPWPLRKAEYDQSQAIDACLKHGMAGCGHCAEITGAAL